MVDKYTNFAKKYASPAQYKHALEILLPTSPIYNYLEGRIPNPAYSYMKIAEITEAEEREKINTEIGQRRTRLGAKIDQVTQDVNREVLVNSDLEMLYGNIIDWTTDDETRRQCEEKLLQHAYDTLNVLEPSKKREKRERVQSLARGLVILKHPFALAWKIVLEWTDVENIESMDGGLLREFIEFYPDNGLSKVLQGYLESDISPFPKPSNIPEEAEEAKDELTSMTSEDRIVLMTECLDDGSNSVLANRLMGEYFSSVGEYESAAAVARQGQKQIGVESRISGLKFSNNMDAINIILATALVQYQAPRHHPEAISLFEAILLRKPTQISALIGVGLILEEQEDYGGASDYLERALERSLDPRIKAEAAWCKALRDGYKTGILELEACLCEMEGSDAKIRTLRAQTLYRIGVCLWEQNTSKTMRKDRNGAYARFISALQADLNFAPAYTSLGIYYADYAKDKKRARKCFQKAFELSASEVNAAERLAISFANSKDWDLVEAVAERVIESGKVKPSPGSKRKGASWPFAALGVVHLNKQDYNKSVLSFQSALRSSPDDYHCWVGLGESYHNSGRHIAATRAFEQAQKLLGIIGSENARSGWFCQYMLANVKRELGDFAAAIQGYREVLKFRPAEFGVSIALLQTLIESAQQNIQLGCFGRAANVAVDAVFIAKEIARHHGDAFNLWKAIGDACSIFSWVQAYVEDFPIKDVQEVLESGIRLEEYDLLADFDGVGTEFLKGNFVGLGNASIIKFVLYAAILAYKRSIHVCINDIHARAVAWYNLGWAEYRAHVCIPEEARLSSKKKSLKFLTSSVQCFKRAIEMEAGNSDFWNALGIATAELNPQVSQHSFVRSLYLDERSARVWTNLGTLYLLQNDYELANQAFARAQSADPDYAHAWVGQGMLATYLGENKEAYTLFTHAFEIADSSSAVTMREYGLSAFNYLQNSTPLTDVLNIIQPRLALQQLCCQKPAVLAFEHILFLFAERIGDFSPALESLETICSALEAEYERSESSTALSRFSQAKAELSRAQLAVRDFTAAVESAEIALDLSADEDLQHKGRKKLRLSAHLTSGLAHFHLGSVDTAIQMFRNALEETQGAPDIVCLLVKVLWAKGGIDERTVARDQLSDCIKKFPGHFGTTILLGLIFVLDNDQSGLQTIHTDLESLRTSDSLSLQQQSQLTQLLDAIATITYADNHNGETLSATSEALTGVMLAPSRPHSWARLADTSAEVYPAEMAVLTTLKAVPPGGSLAADDLCRAYAGTERFVDAQRAVMFAPWVARGWEALSRSCRG